MASMSDMPAVPGPHGQGDEPNGQMSSSKDFKYVHSQSIAHNFGSLIARTDRKPSKPGKTKSKKRPPEQADIANNLAFDRSNGRPPPPPPPPRRNFNQGLFVNRPSSFSNHGAPPPLGPIPSSLPPNAMSADARWDGASMEWEAPDVYYEKMEDGELSEAMDESSGSEAETPIPVYQLDGASDEPFVDPSQFIDRTDHLKVNDLSDCMDLSSGPEAEEDSDDDSAVSQRASTTPFNDSAASSNTSTNISNGAKSSTDEHHTFNNALKAPSPLSEVSSQLSPARSTTPAALKPALESSKTTPSAKSLKSPRMRRVNFSEKRPKTAVTENLSASTVAQQGIHAAYASRLNPFALHNQEYRLLRDHICHSHVTAYLNIRNRILRLWVRNPLVQVTAEEAAGCAQSVRWKGLAKVAYEWLVRKGYINFGCLEIPDPPDLKTKKYKLKRIKKKTIAIVGAGMAGLGCARQLQGLIQHYKETWTAVGEEPPNVVLLEGRNRIGGRLYSHPLKNQNAKGIPDKKRCTAEMGAHIIIGFDHGNPLSMIVRGQLALPYHTLKDNSTLHDTNGDVVEDARDHMVEALYNDCLDRASAYRHRMPHPMTVEGDRELIELGKDPQQKGGPSIAEVEVDTPNIPAAYSNNETESVPGGMDKLTGKAHMITGPRKKEPPAAVAEAMGWRLGENVVPYDDLNLDAVVQSTDHPTLGAAMDEAVKQYQFLLDLTPQDMRLINWHYANLEYANAANVGKLSLGGWDQDAGNEFEGRHTQIIGGYQQVPRAIYQAPAKLDLRTRKAVKKIEYSIWSGNSKTPGAKIHCEDGDTIDSDYVVLTSPLGVLKDRAIEFSPALPDWKLGPIDRLGFGILNKCILVYDEPFWDVDKDMFGLLREPEVEDSVEQEDYVANRGRFYFFWNCIKTCGRPVLISLLAGDAAQQAEHTSDAELVSEVTGELAKIFKGKRVPPPQESIITRWAQDRFARGTYSYVGAEAIPGDYDVMAARVGNLHFAGEATCATHPATVHGAYISGLRAASEIIDDLLGPIDVPENLVSAPTHVHAEDVPKQDTPIQPQRVASSSSSKPKVAPALAGKPAVSASTTPSRFAPAGAPKSRKARLETFEADIIDAINKSLGYRPSPPKNIRPNAYILYTHDMWASVKAEMAAQALPSTKKPADGIRTLVGTRWTALSDEERRPWQLRAEQLKEEGRLETLSFDERLRTWDAKAIDIRRRFIEEHPDVLTQQEEKEMWVALEQYGEIEGVERKAKKNSGYADPTPTMGGEGDVVMG